MPVSMHYFNLLLSAAALVACAGHGMASERLRFDGMPMESRETLVEQVDVNADDVLQFDLGRQQLVTVGPWPGALPKHLRSQYVTLKQTVHPAGAMQSLSLRTAGSKEPWLTLVANGGLNWVLMPGIRLRRTTGGDLRIASVKIDLPVAPGQTVKFQDDAMHCWQFGLLALRKPAGMAGIAQEGEPRADWYLRGDEGC
ncbi:MAG: hypothetical protein ABI171_13560 [Collimonas sp.]|uniref:hypothetical protein n=1 Tax=Collimonas sp. TaxID=1963772 RepID=UPI003266888E